VKLRSEAVAERGVASEAVDGHDPEHNRAGEGGAGARSSGELVRATGGAWRLREAAAVRAAVARQEPADPQSLGVVAPVAPEPAGGPGAADAAAGAACPGEGEGRGAERIASAGAAEAE